MKILQFPSKKAQQPPPTTPVGGDACWYWTFDPPFKPPCNNCSQCFKAALEGAPMRMLRRQTCLNCNNVWQAPSRGNCPVCHSENTQVVESIPCMAKRV